MWQKKLIVYHFLMAFCALSSKINILNIISFTYPAKNIWSNKKNCNNYKIINITYTLLS